VTSVDAIPSTEPPFVTGSCLDIEFDGKAFQGVAPDFPADHFAAIWRGEMQVFEAGTYTFYARSDDGSKVYIDNTLVVDNDGLHGMEAWKQGTLELAAGWFSVAVRYFEQAFEQGIQVKYSVLSRVFVHRGCISVMHLLRDFLADRAVLQGPDTFQKIVFLRGFHAGVVPAMDPKPDDLMFRGFAASYFKIPSYVTVMPDLSGMTPDFTGTSIDVDYDDASFKAISEDLSDNFAVRWCAFVCSCERERVSVRA
jgi:hypothetical protein